MFREVIAHESRRVTVAYRARHGVELRKSPVERHTENRTLIQVDHRVIAGDIFAGQTVDADPLAKALVFG